MNDLASLLAIISESLRKHSLSVSCAESVTVGRIQSLLATNSGASEYFVGGITAYNFEQKVRHLSIDPDHALACNCVSDRVACEMAMGACNLFHSDLGLATTGYAEPCADHNVTDPFAYVAVATVAGDVRVERIMAPSTNCDRRHAMEHFATEAIRMLGDQLEQCD